MWPDCPGLAVCHGAETVRALSPALRRAVHRVSFAAGAAKACGARVGVCMLRARVRCIVARSGNVALPACCFARAVEVRAALSQLFASYEVCAMYGVPLTPEETR